MRISFANSCVPDRDEFILVQYSFALARLGNSDALERRENGGGARFRFLGNRRSIRLSYGTGLKYQGPTMMRQFL
jgi:hypothetical protein